MSKPVFDVTFYGIIQPGKDKDMVIENMANLFKTTPDKVRPFFAGGRKVIKSGVDELTAEKYLAALQNVGLVIKLEASETKTETQESAATEYNDDEISLAPVGADVLENPPEVEPQPIADVSDITLAEAGTNVLENPPEVEPQPIGDISDITLAELGTDVLENPPVAEPRPIGDISDITLAEVGADVIEHPKPKQTAPIPDTSELSVEDER